MSELLLQTIVEKLEAIELLLTVDKQDQHYRQELGDIRKTINELSTGLKAGRIPTASLSAVQAAELSQSLEKLSSRLEMPAVSKTQHHHHLQKGVWWCIGTLLVAILMAWGWLGTYQRLGTHEASAFKYRYFKAWGNREVLRLCRYTDSLYQKDRDGFRSQVEQREWWLSSLVDSMRLAGEKKVKGNK